MQLKSGVRIQGIQPEMILACLVVEQHIPGFTMTSALDGQHSAKSKHKLGYAIDIRTHNLSPEEAVNATGGIKRALGSEFYVLLETDHIYIQFNGSEIL